MTMRKAVDEFLDSWDADDSRWHELAKVLRDAADCFDAELSALKAEKAGSVVYPSRKVVSTEEVESILRAADEFSEQTPFISHEVADNWARFRALIESVIGGAT